MYMCFYPIADLCIASHAHAMGLPAGLVFKNEGTYLVSRRISSRRGHTTACQSNSLAAGEDAISPQRLPSPENHGRRNRTVCASTGNEKDEAEG